MNIAHGAQQSGLCNVAVCMLADFTSGLGRGKNEPVAGSSWGTELFSQEFTPLYDELVDERRQRNMTRNDTIVNNMRIVDAEAK